MTLAAEEPQLARLYDAQQRRLSLSVLSQLSLICQPIVNVKYLA